MSFNKLPQTKYQPCSDAAMDMITIFRTEKMHSSDSKRLIVHVKDVGITSLIFSLLARDGRKEWKGPRPPGFLEVEAQRQLDKLKK